MFNLSEYRNKPQNLADFLPWAALVADGIVLNKDGSFQRTARFRGPDLESATQAELVGVTARLNNALRRLGSGWAIFVEASRFPARGYPASTFPDPVSTLVDAERMAQFEEEGAHFESAYYLTFVFLPPPEEAARMESFLYEGRADGSGIEPGQILKGFIDRTDRVLQLIEGFVPEAAWLSDGETLTYLHSCISTRRQRVRVPEVPMYLDAILVDEPLTGGLAPRLGKANLRTLTVMGFPSITYPGILDDLNRLAIPYRWCTRAIALDKTDATRALTETEGLIGTSAAPAVLAYLFHRVEGRLDGSPTLLIIDEGWLALDDPTFGAQLREWLKTLRKKNASVVFATQSLVDIETSAIAAAIVESCPTRLFLPNERAIEPQITSIYRRFGLNDRQIEILARATPKRDYYCQSRRGNRLFELGLGSIALAFTAASSKADQAAIADLLTSEGRAGFATAWLRHKGLDWAMDYIDPAAAPKAAAALEKAGS